MLFADLAINLILLGGLVAYRKANNDASPAKIIVYRNYVSEDLIPPDFNYEASMLKHESTKFAFIVVSKSDKRFFQKQNLNNPPSGTVVDDKVTRVGHSEFLIVNNESRNGYYDQL